MPSVRCSFRGRGFFLVRASFLLPALLSLAQLQDENATLPLIPDQTGESTVYFDGSNPLIFADLQDGPLWFDSSLNLPLGSFMIHQNPLKSPPDSLANRTFFDYFQGDYGYHDITLGNETTVQSGGRIYFTGAGRSFSGRYGNLGPENSDKSTVLQNYQLRYESAAAKPKIDLGLQYHIENTGLPIDAGSYVNRREESFHLGAVSVFNFNKTHLKLQSAFQSGSYLAYARQFDAFTTWNRMELRRTIREKFSGYFDLRRKSVARQYPGTKQYRNRFTLLNAGINWSNSPFSASLGTAFIAKKFYVTAAFSWQHPGFTLNLKRFVQDNMSADSLMILHNNPYTVTTFGLKIRYSGIIADINIGQVDWKGDQIPTATYDLGYDWHWVHLKVGGNYTASDSALFDSRLTTSLRLDPGIPGKRYHPYLEVHQSYTHFGGYRVLDLSSATGYAPFYGSYFSTNDLGFEIGFNVHNFQFSYHMEHLLPDGLTYSPNFLPVEELNYFRVLWTFEN